MKSLQKIRVNPVDIGILFVVAACIFGFFLFFYRKSEYVNIRVKVTDKDVLYAQTQPQAWYANRFEVGDFEPDALGRKITEIEGVEAFSVSADKKAVYLDLRVKATYDTRTKLFSSRGKTLAFGMPMRFTLSHVTFDALVTEFPGSHESANYSVGSSRVSAIAREVEPSVAAAINEGDTIADSNGIVLAQILGAVVNPAERVTETAGGDLLLRHDPLYKDIILTLSVRTKTFQGEPFIFDNMPLKIGEPIPLNFTNTSIFPIITDVSVLEPPANQ